MNTVLCDNMWAWIEKYRKGELPKEWWFGNIKGELIPISQLADTQDGCEVVERLGMKEHCMCPNHNQRFKFVDESSGTPIAFIRYKVLDNEGHCCLQGMTNEDGYTEKIHFHEETNLKVIVMDDTYLDNDWDMHEE